MLMTIDSTKRIGMLVRAFLNQKSCGADHVAADHDPVGPGVRPERAVQEREELVGVPAVPGGEELHRVGVADHRPGHEHDLRHVVEVPERDDVLEAERLAADHHERQHHGEPGEDRAGDEVGREDRRMPSGEERDREVHRDDRMHREDERRREGREDEVGDLVVMPLPHASHAIRGRRNRRRTFGCGSCARSRIVARSGIRPTYQNRIETVP